MNKNGFTLIEVVITVGILALLAGISVVFYGEYASTSKESTTIQNLDTLRRTIEMSEATTRIPCKSGSVDKLHHLHFSGNSYDPWGNTYCVSRENKLVYSFGPDQSDNKGDGDDISIKYNGIEGNPTADPPLNLIAKGKPKAIKLIWTPPARNNGLEFYKIEKRLDGKTEWTILTKELLPASETTSWTDTSSELSMVYYRVTAIYSAGRESKPSQLAGWVPVY